MMSFIISTFRTFFSAISRSLKCSFGAISVRFFQLFLPPPAEPANESIRYQSQRTVDPTGRVGSLVCRLYLGRPSRNPHVSYVFGYRHATGAFASEPEVASHLDQASYSSRWVSMVPISDSRAPGMALL